MARKKHPKPVAPIRPAARHRIPAYTWGIGALVLCTLIFYWTPLTSSQASIQWDAVDVHYSSQKYFADHLHNFQLPHWTPYIYSGFPFLADPQVGAWYPLNWPFFLLGITPVAIQAELALHTLIAALGVWALLWVGAKGQHPAAVLGGIAYAFSGFFAGHSSHIGMSQTAAWLPWLLLAVLQSLKTTGAFWPALAGLIAGVMFLVGHFQTFLYSVLACAAAAIVRMIVEWPGWRRVAFSGGVMLMVAALAGAVMYVPGLELLRQSGRSDADFHAATNSPLVASSLATLVVPNALGAVSGDYHGPQDITQYYFYAGLLVIILAAWGLMKGGPRRVLAAALILPALWYGFGPAGGLYLALAKLPGLSSVRAPVHIWFVVALGLAILAAEGLAALPSRFKSPLVLYGCAAILFIDLAYNNSFTNPLTYARASFDELYGNREQLFASQVGRALKPLTRFDAPFVSPSFGPQNHGIDTRTPVTYGYNPLALRSYSRFRAAAASNPKLLDELGALIRLDQQTMTIARFDTVLPRAMFPKRVLGDGSASLASLNPAEEVLSPIPFGNQDPAAVAAVGESGEGFYRIRYRASTPSLLRVAEAYYPGWEAQLNSGRSLDVYPVDQAMIGLTVPSGEGEILLRFHTRGLLAGALLSLAGLSIAVLLMIRGKSGQLI